MPIELVKPNKEYVDSYIKAIDSMIEKEVEIMYNDPRDYDSVDEFLTHLSDMEKGVNLPDSFVPATTRWLVNTDTKEFIAQGNIRHRLTDNLRNFGGHVGYLVNPKYWQQGYGTKLLQRLREECKIIGLEKILVTCSPDNIGSKKIIEANGGKFDSEEQIFADGKDRTVRRYWIDL